MRCLGLAFLALVSLPAVGFAQFGFGCHPCATARIAPAPVIQSRLVPQVQTTYRPQNVVTYQPVQTTQIRRQAVNVDVPVTTHRQVTVDEGSYQTVWVPKLVTKTVAQTQMQRQVKYVDVPYQVVHNVPRVQTQFVPQQAVAYVPQTYAYPSSIVSSTLIPSVQTTIAPNSFAPTVVQKPQEKLVPIPSEHAATGQSNDWKQVPKKNQIQASGDVQLQSFEWAASAPAKNLFVRPRTSIGAISAGRMIR